MASCCFVTINCNELCFNGATSVTSSRENFTCHEQQWTKEVHKWIYSTFCTIRICSTPRYRWGQGTWTSRSAETCLVVVSDMTNAPNHQTDLLNGLYVSHRTSYSLWELYHTCTNLFLELVVLPLQFANFGVEFFQHFFCFNVSTFALLSWWCKNKLSQFYFWKAPTCFAFCLASVETFETNERVQFATKSTAYHWNPDRPSSCRWPDAEAWLPFWEKLQNQINLGIWSASVQTSRQSILFQLHGKQHRLLDSLWWSKTRWSLVRWSSANKT